MLPLPFIKGVLEIDCADDDEFLMHLEETAVDWVEGQTGVYFGPVQTVDAIVDGSGSPELWLRDEATVINLVSYRSDPTSAAGWTDYAATDYEVEGRLLFRLGSDWPRGRRNIKVNLERGFANGSEPAAARTAVLLLVADRYRRKGKEGYSSEKIGDYSYTVADAETTTSEDGVSVMEMIWPLRTRVVV